MGNLKIWEELQVVLNKYPSIFESQTIRFEVYLRFTALVNSRCFGSGLPSSSLVPMADNFNHGNKHCSWGLVNKSLHLEGDPKNKYFL